MLSRNATRCFAAAAILATGLLALSGPGLGARAGRTYTSHRFHYSIPVPAGFRLVAAKDDLIAGVFPSAGGTDLDQFVKGGIVIGVASTSVKPGTTLAEWQRLQITLIRDQYNCTKPARSAARIGGVAAAELVYPDCFGYFDTIEAVRGGRGYDVYWLGPDGGIQTRTKFHAAIASFRFAF